MENTNNNSIFTYWAALKEHWRVVVIFIAVLFTLGLYINFFLPHKYRSDTEVLYAQKQTASIDAFTATKSAEQIALTFSNIVYSASFFDQVSQRVGLQTDSEYRLNDTEKRLKKWKKSVDVSVVPGTGILKVSVYHPDRAQAHSISQAIANVLTTNKSDYIGDGDFVSAQILSSPITTNKYATPNMGVNILLSILIGAGMSAAFLWITVQEGKPSSRTRSRTIKPEDLSPNLAQSPASAELQSQSVQLPSLPKVTNRKTVEKTEKKFVMGAQRSLQRKASGGYVIASTDDSTQASGKNVAGSPPSNLPTA